MEPMLENVKVVELTMWGFVPSSAAILADWGAEVIKIEMPGSGDPMRGLLNSQGMQTPGNWNYYFEQFNRSKRGIQVNVGHPEGREVFLKLIEQADVFVTSFLEPAREKLKITYEELKAVNPRLIYARGHGQGQRGPDATAGGFDAASYWARSSVAHMVTPVGGPFVGMPAGAFGDVQGGLALAAGVAAALYRRSVSGQGGLVDVSLLGTGAWAMAATLLSSQIFSYDPKAQPAVAQRNPLLGPYKTSDGRFVWLNMLDADRYWPSFCKAIAHEELIDDPRFNSFDNRGDNREALITIIAESVVARPLAEWRERLTAEECVYGVAQTPLETVNDRQTVANKYVFPDFSGEQILISSPVQYNNGFVEARRQAPEAGQHTEEVLLELGYDWDKIIALKETGAIN